MAATAPVTEERVRNLISESLISFRETFEQQVGTHIKNIEEDHGPPQHHC
jgi:hypothetical protein